MKKGWNGFNVFYVSEVVAKFFNKSKWSNQLINKGTSNKFYDF